MYRGIRGIDPSSALYTRLVTDLDEHRRVGRREEQRDRARDQQARDDEATSGEESTSRNDPGKQAGVYRPGGSPADVRDDDDDPQRPIDVVA